MKTFTQNIINIYCSKGEVWLATLPALTAELACKYNSTYLQLVANMSSNYVAAAL